MRNIVEEEMPRQIDNQERGGGGREGWREGERKRLMTVLATTPSRSATLASLLVFCIFLLSILLLAAKGTKLIGPQCGFKVGK